MNLRHHPSLIRGQLNYVISNKNGFLPFAGKVLLLAHFAIGTAARVFAVLLYFTPCLGLFDTLYHSKLGLMPVKNAAITFQIDVNGTQVLFRDLWEGEYRLRSSLDFYDYPTSLMCLTLPLMVAVHLFVSQIFKRVLYYRGISSCESMLGQLDMCTIVSPPIHLDWERLYRCNGSSGANLSVVSVSECWKRSMLLLVAYNVLLLMEHLLLLAPLIKLREAIATRNNFLMRDFPATADERMSTHMVTMLLSVAVASFIVLPFATFGLAYVYFKKWHAWSRILKSRA